MLHWPKWFKMAAINHFATIREEMLMIALRKNIFIIFTCYIYRFRISMLQPAIWECKILTFFPNFASITFLQSPI